MSVIPRLAMGLCYDIRRGRARRGLPGYWSILWPSTI